MVFARLGLRPPFAAAAAVGLSASATIAFPRGASAAKILSSLPARALAGSHASLMPNPTFGTGSLNKLFHVEHVRFNHTERELAPAVEAKGRVLQVIENHVKAGVEDAFYVVDLDDIVEKHQKWVSLLPRVQPFYAVKCNPDPVVLRLLAGLGSNFDCASRPEMDAVLSLGVSPDRIVYANPCKQISHVRYASHRNVKYMTFDSCDELDKLKQFHPNAHLILRIKADDSHSQCEMGSKYGANLGDVEMLLKHAISLDLNVCGVSYHVGSGCYSEYAFVDAVERARKAFNTAASLGLKFDLLDIGGGFPGDVNAPISFDRICEVLAPALDKNFPEDSGVNIIAEPGRYYVGSSHTLTVNVIGRKAVSTQRSAHPAGERQASTHASGKTSVHAKAVHTEASIPSYMYYVNDGLYGSFNCLLYDHATVHPVALSTKTDKPESFQRKLVDNESPALASHDELMPCSIWGPTCDGLDCITKDAKLPQLDVGQWIYFANMGAYTAAAGSQFNGFPLPDRLYMGSGDFLSKVIGESVSMIKPEEDAA